MATPDVFHVLATEADQPADAQYYLLQDNVVLIQRTGLCVDQRLQLDPDPYCVVIDVVGVVGPDLSVPWALFLG